MAFSALVEDDDRVRFDGAYQKLVFAERDSIDQKLNCENCTGDELQTVVNVSPVRADTG